MYKSVVLAGLILFLSFTFIFAEEDEDSVTIITSYPSPYGVYIEMRTESMVIGDINAATTPAPSDGAITFMPTTQPSSYSKGTLYYDGSADCFKYYDGQDWKKL